QLGVDRRRRRALCDDDDRRCGDEERRDYPNSPPRRTRRTRRNKPGGWRAFDSDHGVTTGSPAPDSAVLSAGTSPVLIAVPFACIAGAPARARAIAFSWTVVGRTSASWSEFITRISPALPPSTAVSFCSASASACAAAPFACGLILPI